MTIYKYFGDLTKKIHENFICEGDSIEFWLTILGKDNIDWAISNGFINANNNSITYTKLGKFIYWWNVYMR